MYHFLFFFPLFSFLFFFLFFFLKKTSSAMYALRKAECFINTGFASSKPVCYPKDFISSLDDSVRISWRLGSSRRNSAFIDHFSGWHSLIRDGKSGDAWRI